MRLVAALFALLAATGAAAQIAVPQVEHNDFEWSAVAPIVVTATSLGDVARLHELRVRDVLRGDVEPGDQLMIDLKQANRARDRLVHPKRLELEAGVLYAVLLQPTERVDGDDDGPVVYWLVRGVEGVRELPAEGAEARIDALRTFTEIQDLKSHPVIWHRMRQLLEDTNPYLIATALDQHLKFRRTELDLLPVVRPLLDHPRDDVRRDAAGVIANIVERHVDDDIPEAERIKAELAGVARRDRSIDVRIAATEALGQFDDQAATAILEEVAAEDDEQMVRYTAERLLLERRQRAGN